MATATDHFSGNAVVGQGGYGKVYKGILADGMIVAVKRAQEGSLQGEKEFLTEIQFLSRLHHRNLVSLIGYCDEEGEQVFTLDCKTFMHLEIFLNGFNIWNRIHFWQWSSKEICFPLHLYNSSGKSCWFLLNDEDWFFLLFPSNRISSFRKTNWYLSTVLADVGVWVYVQWYSKRSPFWYVAIFHQIFAFTFTH